MKTCNQESFPNFISKALRKADAVISPLLLDKSFAQKHVEESKSQNYKVFR